MFEQYKKTKKKVEYKRNYINLHIHFVILFYHENL